MGNLYLYDSDFEPASIPQKARNDVVADFFAMKSGAERDCFYASNDLMYHKQFSFGVGLYTLFTMSWPEICATPSCAGIEEMTYNLLHNALWYKPVINEGYHYDQLPEPKALAKFREVGDASTFVTNINSWKEWHASWYRAHQDQISWVDGKCNDLLPFVDYAIDVMRDELVKQKKFYIEQRNASSDSSLYITEIKEIDSALHSGGSNKSAITHAFHSLVMARKGQEMRAYACEVGGKILEVNGYTHDVGLSAAEHNASNAPRRIYTIVNRNRNKQYVSLDFGHGMFEFYDQHGTHLGERRYDGSFNSEADPSHNLKTIS